MAMQLDYKFILQAFTNIFQALPNTLYMTFISVTFGFIIGAIVAAVRVYKVPVLRQIAVTYVTFIRGTPMLMHLLLIYFGLPIVIDKVAQSLGSNFQSSSIPLIVFAYIAFSITAGAYMAEVIRSGILSVDKGQIEAAHSIGMTSLQTLRRIILPQALGASIPNLSNNLIGMLHGTTLAFTISVVEINAQAEIVAATNWKFLEAYIAAALLFWGLTIIIERFSLLLERRITVYNRGGVA